MKIRRKISEVMLISGEKAMPLTAALDKAYPCCPLDELEFSLSDGELHEAYREQQKIFQLRDAKNHLEYFVFGTERAAMNEEDEAAEMGWFQKQYGFSYEDATNPSSEFYILEEAVCRFQDRKDCNIDENSIWARVIESVLEDLSG